MIGKSFNINLDFYREIINTTPAFNNDDYNNIKFNLFNNGVSYEPLVGETVIIKIQGHTFLISDLIWHLGAVALGIAGTNEAELQIVSVDKRITTFKFNYVVAESLSKEGVQADVPELLSLIQLNELAFDQATRAEQALADTQVIKAEIVEISAQALQDIETSKISAVNEVTLTKNNAVITVNSAKDLALVDINASVDIAVDTKEQSEAILLDLNSKIINDVITGGTTKILSAEQGKVLNTKIIDIEKGLFSDTQSATQPIISLPTTAVKGGLTGSIKGNTLYQVIIGGENQPTGTTKSFIALNGVKYFLLPSKTIITGAGVPINVTNSTGVNANIMAVQLITPYENWTADQINNMIDGYWEGLGGTQPSRVKSVGKNLLNSESPLGLKSIIDLSAKTGSYLILDSENKEFEIKPSLGNVGLAFQGKVKPLTNYRISLEHANINASSATGRINFLDSSGSIKRYLDIPINTTTSYVMRNLDISTQAGEVQINVTIGCGGTAGSVKWKKLMLNEGTTALPYEPYAETTLYCPVTLNSLPNGIKDEFYMDGRHLKRIKIGTNKTGIVDYSDMATGGSFIASLSDGTVQTGIKGDTLTVTSTTILYQLTTPIETQYNASALASNPSGTIYVESVVKTLKTYSTNIMFDTAIKSLESVTLVTGDKRTPIATSLVTIAIGGLSATISNAVANQIYEFVYTVAGKTLATLDYKYANNLAAEVQNNTAGVTLTSKMLNDFIAYQNAVNLQFDFRLVAGGH